MLNAVKWDLLRLSPAIRENDFNGRTGSLSWLLPQDEGRSNPLHPMPKSLKINNDFFRKKPDERRQPTKLAASLINYSEKKNEVTRIHKITSTLKKKRNIEAKWNGWNSHFYFYFCWATDWSQLSCREGNPIPFRLGRTRTLWLTIVSEKDTPNNIQNAKGERLEQKRWKGGCNLA